MKSKLFYLLILLFIFSLPVMAQEGATLEKPKPVLKVGVNIAEPIIFKQDGKYKGHSIDLWEQVADDLNLSYEYVETKTYDAEFLALKNKEIDVGISGLYLLSKRDKFIDFTVPTFNVGQQIMVLSTDSIFWRMFNTIFSQTLLNVLCIFCGFIILAAHIIWFIERKSNPAFSYNYLEGIMESIWWTTVTLTTVGYGDKIPHRVTGKFFAIFWMLMGYFILAYFTASITSVLTVSQIGTSSEIQNIADLKGKRVGTVEGPLVESLQQYDFKLMLYKTIDEIYPHLNSGELDAIILDSPILKYYALHKGKGKVTVVGEEFDEEYWGIALQQNSPYREMFNLELMRLHENGFIKKINDKWFEGIERF